MSDRDAVASRNELRAERAGTRFGSDVPWAVAWIVGLAYFAGVRIGFALTSDTGPLSLLWPPNALLLGALLLLPTRHWWLALLGVFAAHVLAQSIEGVPLLMALAWFASNVGEALLAALLLGRTGRMSRLDSGRAVLAFLAAATAAVVVASFADAGLVRLIGGKEADFWAMWQSRVPANILAIIIFVPACLALREALRARRPAPQTVKLVELAVFALLLLGASGVAFGPNLLHPSAATWSGLLYLPVPLLLWAALRFGPLLSSLSFSIVAFVVVWGVQHGSGPFVETAAAFGASADAIAVVRRADGRVVEANARWSRLFAQPSEPIEALLRSRHDIRDLEITLPDAPDGPRRVQMTIKAAGPDPDDLSICALHDVTALRRAQREQCDQRLQLTHLNRVAVLAGLAGSLAHELNQPLTAILSNAQAARRFLDRAPLNIAELRAILDDIVDADKRAGALIHHLRLMMKKGDEHFEPLDPGVLIGQVMHLACGDLLRQQVELRKNLSHDLPPLRGDRIQLQQLLLNLISNACDAMAAKGGSHRVLSITALASRSGETHILVDDNGTGIPEHQREAVFEPFFTSKSNGMGLGLSICRLIAERHGGSLAAEDRVDEGTRMRLVLPLSAAATGETGVG
jgi:signal transduction histidine kinase